MRALFLSLPPAITALLLQFAALILTLLALRATGLQATPLAYALLCGALAAVLSYLLGLARWWLAIQFLFAPALVVMLSFDIPSGYFLAAFLVLLAVYWSAYRSQVPLYLSSKQAWQALETLLPPAGKAFRFMDIGSGMGGVLIHLARVRPEGRYHGVESAPLPWLASWLRIKLGRQHNCRVHWGSLWDADLSQYDVVFAYLSPAPMPRLWEKVQREMRPGSVFVSNTFAVPDQPPQQTIMLDDLHRSTLYIWRF